MWIRRNAASIIDRILMDQDFFIPFPKIQAFCKQKVFSVHFPIVVQTSQFHWGPTPFRSLDCWLEEPSFLDAFKKEWVQLTGEAVEKKLKALKKPLQKWNREVFGHIEAKRNLGN